MTTVKDGGFSMGNKIGMRNSFKLFQLAKKSSLCTRFLSFFPSITLLCNSKKYSTWHKTLNFRFNLKSLNEFKPEFDLILWTCNKIRGFHLFICPECSLERDRRNTFRACLGIAEKGGIKYFSLHF